jgi:hypothetical protein
MDNDVPNTSLNLFSTLTRGSRSEVAKQGKSRVKGFFIKVARMRIYHELDLENAFALARPACV